MTKIEWTHGLNGRVGRTWNPVAGCTVISPGCTNCYAMRMAARINKMTPGSHYEGLTKIVNGNPVWTGKIAKSPDHIFTAPLKWKKPSLVFVNSMSDLFHDDVEDDWIDQVFAVMVLTEPSVFQILTKRPDRAQKWFETSPNPKELPSRSDAIAETIRSDYSAPTPTGIGIAPPFQWPLPNVWLGVSVESSDYLYRIDELRQIPAAVRFLSLEPLLGPLENIDLTAIHWVIVGGESGPGKRPVDLAWLRSIRDQCMAAGVPLFVKQIDKRIPIPDDLMIRQWPKGIE